jgi:uncharacterized membrane protein YcfT
MGPPTLVIVALTVLQVGLVLLLREWVEDRLATSTAWQRLFRWVNENSLPLYLLHTTGMAIVVAVIYAAFRYLPPDEPNVEWWLSRPLWFLAPAIATYPFLVVYAGVTGRAKNRQGADELAT